MRRRDFSTLTFSSRMLSALRSDGGDMAIMHRICSRWFWIMSRICPARVKVTPAPFNAHLFCHGDFNMIDGTAVPVIDEQGVGKAQRQQVEDRLFAEIVVDTIDWHSSKTRRHGR